MSLKNSILVLFFSGPTWPAGYQNWSRRTLTTTWTHRHQWAPKAWRITWVWTRKVSREVRYLHLPLGFGLKLSDKESKQHVKATTASCSWPCWLYFTKAYSKKTPLQLNKAQYHIVAWHMLFSQTYAVLWSMSQYNVKLRKATVTTLKETKGSQCVCLMFLLPAKVRMRLKTQKPECPPKPPDLAQRVRSLMALTRDDEFPPGHRTDATQSMCFLPSHDSSSPTRKTQTTGATFSGSFDDLDIPFIDEDEDLTAG